MELTGRRRTAFYVVVLLALVLATTSQQSNAASASKPILGKPCLSREVGSAQKFTPLMAPGFKVTGSQLYLTCVRVKGKFIWEMYSKSKKSVVFTPITTPATSTVTPSTTQTASPTPTVYVVATPTPTVYVPNWDGYIAPKGVLTFTSCIRTKSTDNQQVTSAPGTTLTGSQYLWSVSGKVVFSGGHYIDGYRREIAPDMKVTENFSQNVSSISPDYPGYSGKGQLFGTMLTVYAMNIRSAGSDPSKTELTDADIKYITISQPLPDGFCKYE